MKVKDVDTLECNKINMERNVKKAEKYFTNMSDKILLSKIDEDLIGIFVL